MIFLMGVAVLVVIGIHTVEAWGWALVYYLLGEFNEIAQALYFSVVTSTTLGYGDVTLSKDGRLVGSFEAMGGLILFGAGTAFLLRVVGHLFQDARVQSAASD
jgi:voltage-gated potassium channel Kch